MKKTDIMYKIDNIDKMNKFYRTNEIDDIFDLIRSRFQLKRALHTLYAIHITTAHRTRHFVVTLSQTKNYFAI